MKKTLPLFIIGIILMSIGWLLSFSYFGDPPLERASEVLAEGIEDKKAEARSEIALIQSRLQALGPDSAMIVYSDYYAQLFDKEGLFIAVFEDNELKLWSDNRVAFDYLFGPGIPDEQYLRLENGWYGLIKHIEQNREYYSLFLIRTAYPYQNQHLSDDFHRDIGLSNHFNIVLRPTPTSAPVLLQDQTIFHLERTGRNKMAGMWLNFILLLTGFILFMRGGQKLTHQSQGLRFIAIIIPIILIALRILSLSVSGPFGDIKLFDPTLYASSYLFPSLGDLLINSIVLAYSGYFIGRLAGSTKFSEFNWVRSTLLIFSFFTLALLASPLVIGLIRDSHINFNLNEIFNLDEYTLLAVVSVGFLVYALYSLGSGIVHIVNYRKASPQKLAIAFLIALAAHILLAHWMGIVDFKIILWPLPVLFIMAWGQSRPEYSVRVRARVLLLIYFSVVSGVAILKYSKSKERSERIVYAEKLASDEDPVTELLFNSTVQDLRNDEHIRELLSQPEKYSSTAVATDIANLFIDRYWNKYDFNIHIYKPDSSYWGILPESRPPDFEYFNSLIKEHGFPSSTNPHLFHLYNYPENLSYLGRVPIQKNDSLQLAWVIIGLESTLFPDEIGFPELLIDQSTDRPRSLKPYSYARYIDGKLVSTTGKYNYRINTRLYQDNTQKFEFESYNQFNHLVHRVDERTVVVVSKEELTIFDEITIICYLFALFGVLHIGILLMQNPSLANPSIFNHLNVKIQLLSTVIILVALISFGVATRFYTVRQFEEKNKSILSEKIQSVIIELEGQLRNEDRITEPLIDRLKSRLTKLSYVFFTDINLYDLQGQLVATSQPKIFDEGLIAPRMNAEAFTKIAINKKSDYIHQEKIGTLKHLSAYVPFRNYNNDIVAYVNLPYFARQDTLENEMTRFFVTLVNIFVLLLAFSVFAAVFISNWITRPLQRLQVSLSKIELGRQNEQIEYKGKDVIGDLVTEYNRKVTELEINAEQLARSERESAWREMAKQVAHEIKNPLTPMKLNIQLLQKAVAEGADNIESRVKRTADVLIEQIDTLSEIASAFSNFAKMPRAELAEVNLNKLLSNATELYRELPGGQVHFSPLFGEDPIVRADYNQLLRAIQNLIKNGLQATHEDQNPVINIRVLPDKGAYIIALKDNGPGIPESLQAKIFQPNFTTKSTGMGLGLAMVQSIVQNVNGKIWFETGDGEGTTFFIKIPAGIQKR